MIALAGAIAEEIKYGNRSTELRMILNKLEYNETNYRYRFLH